MANHLGETFGAIVLRLRQRLARLIRQEKPRPLSEELPLIARRCAALPTLDARTEEEILGYDELGLPR